ncbi:MFS transporter [Streptomyces sp. NPDC052127]|uniref:MFS transporter n=1 Tax=Streptomyces sp. NPDC052127 TaxID=3155679 RepID=UPI003415AB5C
MPAPPPAPPPNPWRTAVVAGMASYLDAGAIVSTATALVLYRPHLGLDDASIGRISALLTFCFAVGALAGGRLGDRFGRRRVLTVTLLLYLLGTLLLAGAQDPAMLHAGAIVVGLSIGADLPVSLALIAEEAPPQHKGRMIALSGLLWAVGIITATLLATVATQFGQTGARLLYGHLVLVAAIVLTLRTTLRESAEWTAAREQEGVTADGPAEEIRLGALRQLCTRPLLVTLLATGLYYALWNLGANTNGQFGDFLWVKLTDHTVQSLTTLKAAAIPFAVAALLIFMRVADRPARRRWFLAGTLLALTGYALPVLAGPTPFTLAALLLLTAIGAGFSGETMYKVWSQELVPTLLRGTVQGVTMAFARLLAAAFAVITPSLATGNSRALFSLNLAFALAAAVIGLLWIPRLPAAAAALTRTEPETAGIQQSPSAAPAAGI